MKFAVFALLALCAASEVPSSEAINLTGGWSDQKDITPGSDMYNFFRDLGDDIEVELDTDFVEDFEPLSYS